MGINCHDHVGCFSYLSLWKHRRNINNWTVCDQFIFLRILSHIKVDRCIIILLKYFNFMIMDAKPSILSLSLSLSSSFIIIIIHFKTSFFIHTELSGIDRTILMRALKFLEQKGKLAIFKGTSADDEGVKFSV